MVQLSAVEVLLAESSIKALGDVCVLQVGMKVDLDLIVCNGSSYCAASVVAGRWCIV
jgi:hypothetical protein